MLRIAHGERLNRNRDDVVLLRGGDLRRAGEAGAQLVRRLIESDDHFEVFGFFNAAGGLAGGDAGRAQESLVANFGDTAFEDFAGQSVDGDIRYLAIGHVNDVGLVDFDLGGDDRHVGEGHEGRAFGVLDALDDHLALADGLVGDDAVEGSDGDGSVEVILLGREGGLLGLEMAAS